MGIHVCIYYIDIVCSKFKCYLCCIDANESEDTRMSMYNKISGTRLSIFIGLERLVVRGKKALM